MYKKHRDAYSFKMCEKFACGDKHLISRSYFIPFIFFKILILCTLHQALSSGRMKRTR